MLKILDAPRGLVPFGILGSGATATYFWLALRYSTLSHPDTPGWDSYWTALGGLMLTGLFFVALICRRSGQSASVSLAFLFLATVAYMILFALGRRMGGGSDSGIHFQVISLGVAGIWASILLVGLVVVLSRDRS